jgi:hypothetical protein
MVHNLRETRVAALSPARGLESRKIAKIELLVLRTAAAETKRRRSRHCFAAGEHAIAFKVTYEAHWASEVPFLCLMSATATFQCWEQESARGKRTRLIARRQYLPRVPHGLQIGVCRPAILAVADVSLQVPVD